MKKLRITHFPNVEQWEELNSFCKWLVKDLIDGKQIQCVGPNGNYIFFSTTGLIKANSYVNKSYIYMWLMDEGKSTSKNCIKRLNKKMSKNNAHLRLTES